MLDKALLNDYLAEADQLIDTLLADVGQLADSRRAGQRIDSRATADLVNRLFRSMHSLKGLCGMMDLPEVQTLAHRFESVLDELRHGTLEPDQSLSERLLEVVEALSILLASAAKGTSSIEELEQVGRLLDTLESMPRQSPIDSGSRLSSIILRPSERALLSTYEETRLVESIREGKFIYRITVTFSVAELDRRFRSLSLELSKTGELITTLPVADQQQDGIGLKLIYASELDAPALGQLVSDYSGSLAKIGGPPASGEPIEPAQPRKRKRKNTAETAAPRPANRTAATAREHHPPADLDSQSLFAVLPPEVAQEALQPLSNSVNVEMSEIDEISGLAHELSIEAQRLSDMADRMMGLKGASPRERFDLKQSSRRLERQFLELEERLVELRMVSLSRTFGRATRLVDRLAHDLAKAVSVEVSGRSTLLDKTIVDRVAGPLYHLLRNAVDHGIEPPEERTRLGKPESGKIKLEAEIEGARVIISISDDGRGIDTDHVLQRAVELGAVQPGEQLTQEEVLRLIFHRGFSTADQISQVSGRGVGLDAVERAVHDLGGEISITSQKGKGSQFKLAVPTTLMMISAFVVRVAEWRYAINVGQILELVQVRPSEIIGPDGKRRVKWRGLTVPLVELKFLLGLGGARRLSLSEGKSGPLRMPAAAGSSPSSQPAAAGRGTDKARRRENRVAAFVTRVADRPIAVAVEQFDDQREVIVKSLGSLARKFRGVSGAVDLEGGDVALVLDLPGLIMLRSLRA